MRESEAGAGPAHARAERRRYGAFISYSRADEAAARRLHEFLETYRLPRRMVGRRFGRKPVPETLAPVFRDRDELAGSPDLGAALERALAASDALIVLCSPRGAGSKWVDREVMTFKRMGRSSRIFAFVVADPEGDATLDVGCFPASLQLEYDRSGRPTGRRSEPLAADSRPDHDGWDDACLKLVAGVAEVPFDALRQREDVRQRRLTLAGRVRKAALAIACLLGYLVLADTDLDLPGGEAIRIELDRQGWTLFRRVHGRTTIARAAESSRERLRTRLMTAVDEGSLEMNATPSPWMAGQVAAALANDRGADAAQIGRAVTVLRRVFATPEGGVSTGLDGRGGPGASRAEHAFWTVMAVAAVLGRPDVTDAETRRWLTDRLADAQLVADSYRPLPDGGWNVVPRQVNPRTHYVYTTGLALHMLLTVRAAGLGWHGDRARLDELIASTVDWLSRSFLQQSIYAGWRRSPSDDRPPDNGVSLLIYAGLARVCTELGTLPNPAIQEAALTAQIRLGWRGYDEADPDIYFDVQTRDEDGKAWPVATVTRMVWYPWAAAGVAHWRSCAARQHLPSEVLRRLDRTLGHLLVDLADPLLRDLDAPERALFVVAETLHGLGRVP